MLGGPGLAEKPTTKQSAGVASTAEANDLAKAQQYFEAGDTIGAIEIWSRLLINQPDHQSARLNRAQAYLILEQQQLALADVEKLLALSKGHSLAEAIILRGVALAALGRHQQAIQDFNEAWRLGKSPAALANKATSLNSLGQGREASEIMKQLVILEPSTANYFSLAKLLKNQGEYQACINSTDLIIRSNPTHSQAYALRGACRYEQGQDERALADLLRSHSLVSNQPETTLTIGKILRKRGKNDEGIQWILKAASLYLIERKTSDHEKALEAAQTKGKS
jgi:tetratricopeptide (TPR) repeat protein